jgi:hypothetical protein
MSLLLLHDRISSNLNKYRNDIYEKSGGGGEIM